MVTGSVFNVLPAHAHSKHTAAASTAMIPIPLLPNIHLLLSTTLDLRRGCEGSPQPLRLPKSNLPAKKVAPNFTVLTPA
jgi:hypothetical protein